MNETTSSALALIPKGIEEAERMATKLSKSEMLPPHFRDKPENVFWALAYGLEVGLTPVQSLQAIYVVHGRPGMYADAMVALVLTSGKADYFVCTSSDAKQATYETKRKGSPKERSLTVTIEDAQAAGWVSNEKYKKEPRRMLEARCKSQLARDVYPDVLRGMESAEDAEADGPRGGGFTAPPPSKGAIIDITTAQKADPVPAEPAPAKDPERAAKLDADQDERAAAEGAPSKDDELAAEAKDILRGIHSSTSVSDLGAQLDPMKALFAKLPKDSAIEKDIRATYKSKKAQLAKAEAAEKAGAA